MNRQLNFQNDFFLLHNIFDKNSNENDLFNFQVHKMFVCSFNVANKRFSIRSS